MPIVALEALDDPRVADYRALRDPDLVRARNLFVAEGRLVLERLVQARRYRIRSVLVSDAVRHALGITLRAVHQDVPIYVAPTLAFRDLAGLNMHRCCLALAERPSVIRMDELVAPARRLVVLDSVANPDNVGGIFRSADAFGVDGVLLSQRCCDPLYRKSIRTSMAATLSVPFARTDGWAEVGRVLRTHGFTIVALEPDAAGTPIATFAETTRAERLALLLGAEGDGLSAEASAIADARVRIPIRHNVDSLNVAVAASIALAMVTPAP